LKNITYIIVFLLFLSFSCSKSKNFESGAESSDSLSSFMAFTKNDNFSKLQRVKYNKKALLLLSNSENDSVYRTRLIEIAREFYYLQQNKDLKKTLDIVLEKSIEKKDSLNLAKAYNLLGSQNINLGKNDSAYYYLLKSEKLFIKLEDSLSLGKNYLDKAFVQMYEGDYSGCELSSIQTLTFLKNFKFRANEYDAYNLIGISSNELKNYENALIYHTKALNTAKEYKLVNEYHLEANSRNNIGVVYQNLNKKEEAIANFELALEDKNLLKDFPSLYAIIIDNLAYSKFKLKDFSNLPDLFYQSLAIREKNNLESGIIANKIHLSEFFSATNDSIKSQKLAQEALLLAKKTNISGDLLGSLKQLSLVDHKNSSQYSKEYINISDSIQEGDKKARNRFARIQYETDEIIQEKDLLAQQNRNLLYFLMLILALAALLFVIRSQRNKNRLLLLKQQQQATNEDIYNLLISQQTTIEENRVKDKNRIGQELHDGVLGRLFGVRLNLDSLNKSHNDDSINTRYHYLNELKIIEQDIREISHDLSREKHFLINNFVAIVHNLLEDQKTSFDPNVNFYIDKKIKWDLKDNQIKINLYRILQESLQNINKYAKAKNINVEFTKVEDTIVLKIADDGLGFQLSNKKNGIGLQNMKSRAIDCAGVFEINSKKGKGTSVIITIPTII